MEEEKGLQGPSETGGAGSPPAAEGRHGPGWRGWALSLLVAIGLSVTAMLLLGGSVAFRPEGGAVPGASGSGCGGACCPPAIAGK